MSWFTRKEEVNVGTIVNACDAFRKKLHSSFKLWHFHDPMVSFQLAVYVCALFKVNNRGDAALFQRICAELMGERSFGRIGDLLPFQYDFAHVSFMLMPEMSDQSWAKNVDSKSRLVELDRRIRAVEMPVSRLLDLMLEVREEIMRDSWLQHSDSDLLLALFLHVFADPSEASLSPDPDIKTEFEMADIYLLGEFEALHEAVFSEMRKSK